MIRFTPDLLAADHAGLTAIRRDIHRHPETAFEEQRTSQIVADKLQSWGIESIAGWPRPASSAP
jgi:metal-dependent amidase/aminoacylase/carboxypeptidase family protein